MERGYVVLLGSRRGEGTSSPDPKHRGLVTSRLTIFQSYELYEIFSQVFLISMYVNFVYIHVYIVYVLT